MTGLQPFPLLTGEDLLQQPEIDWLIDGVAPANGLTEMFSPRKSGKSFVELDQALCVATGTPWQGRQVKQGHVVYFVLEGRGGFGARYRAWCEEHRWPDTSHFHAVTASVNLLDESAIRRAELTFESLPERPTLFVIDTLARAMGAGDESSAKDMGRFVQAVDRLRRDAAAVVLHHSGWDSDRERGSTALGAAADLVMRLERVDKTSALTLWCTDAKDFAEWPPILLSLRERHGSCVIEPRTQTAAGLPAKPARRAFTDSEAEEAVLALLVERAGETDPDRVVGSANDAVRALQRNRKGVLEAFSRLQQANRIHKPHDRYLLVPEGPEPPGNHPLGAPAGGGSREGTPPSRRGPSEPAVAPGDKAGTGDQLFSHNGTVAIPVEEGRP